MITRIGGRAAQFLTVCRDDLKSLVEEGMKLFEIEAPAKELEGDLAAQFEVKDTTIEQLQRNITELSSKINELEAKLKEKPKPQRKATSAKGKGKKK
jgi:predicted transcriptional regulator